MAAYLNWLPGRRERELCVLLPEVRNPLWRGRVLRAHFERRDSVRKVKNEGCALGRG
jgi:hypothetical protein